MGFYLFGILGSLGSILNLDLVLCSDMSGTSGVEKIELLDASVDAHGAVTVDLKEAMDSEAFHSLLRASVSQWMQQVFLFLILFLFLIFLYFE